MSAWTGTTGGSGTRTGAGASAASGVIPMSRTARILSGPAPGAGAESYRDHVARLGPMPSGGTARAVIPALEASGLLGRGGAGFPVGRKWRTVAARGSGRAAVLVNGAEGEPMSAKDRTLMAIRPHLVLEGALLAAEAVGADEIVLYVGEEHLAARTAIAAALGEHPAAGGRVASGGAPRVRLVSSPTGYVSGEESAAVHYVNDGVALPTTVPPRPFEAGVRGRPTLVQNVESLAYAALIARFGPDWFRAAGTPSTPGTALITTSGAVASRVVTEIELGTPIGDVVASLGGATGDPTAVLVGGYFGGWMTAAEAWPMPLEPAVLRSTGHAFGCGVVSVLPRGRCGVTVTASVLAYLAGQSAEQCGPCVLGLGAIAQAVGRLAERRADPGDLDRVTRWSGQLAGRGACHHPDGAAALLQSALRVFGPEFREHQHSRRCTATGAIGHAA